MVDGLLISQEIIYKFYLSMVALETNELDEFNEQSDTLLLVIGTGMNIPEIYTG